MQPTTSDVYSKSLRVTERGDLEISLDRAVDDAIQRGPANPGKGILVTRHDHERFTIEFSDRVEAGLICEVDART